MQQVKIEAEVRTSTGTAASRRLRRKGKLPAVLYGHAVDGVALVVDARIMDKLMGAEGFNGLIDLQVKGEAKGIKAGEQLLTLIKSHQADPVTRTLTHLDLYKVNLKEEVTVSIPIHIEGTSPGVKAGGILDVVRREIELRCLPNVIPEYIVADVSSLEMGQSLHVEDLPLPEGVVAHVDTNYTVAAVVAPTKVEEVAPVETAAEGEEAKEGEEKPEENKAEKKEEK